MKFSIIWKIREKGVVVFRHEFDHEHASLEEALVEFRQHEPDAYVVRAYIHELIDPHLLERLLARVEQKAIADGKRSLGD